MNLSKGERKYLIGILLTENEYGWTRLKWVADFFGVKMSTVKEFLNSLEDKKLITHQRRGAIFLTDVGREIASREKQRLDVLIKFMTGCLVLDDETANKNAMKILFELDDKVSNRLYKFIEFMTLCPTKPVFIDKFESYIKDGKYEMCSYCPVLFDKEGYDEIKRG